MGVNESALMVVMFLFIHYMLEMWLKEDVARQHRQYLERGHCHLKAGQEKGG